MHSNVSQRQKWVQAMNKKLNYQSTAQKFSWSILNWFLKKNKIPIIPTIFHNVKIMSDFKEQADPFKSIFVFQSTNLSNSSVLPNIKFHTNTRLGSFSITKQGILAILSH